MSNPSLNADAPRRACGPSIVACVFFHECVGCHARLRAKPGDCCVFCSYGSVKCPPMQELTPCCAGPESAPS